MLPLEACVGRSDVGGKAETLARMRAAGLPVADGVVLLPDEVVDAAALAAALARLAGTRGHAARFAARSSSSVEDARRGSAAGLFHSVVGVGAADVARVIDEVRGSARSAAVTAYLEARGLSAAAVRVAVLVQPVVDAAVYGVAHSAGDAFAVEERAPGEPEWGDVRGRSVGRDDGSALAAGLCALEALVGGAVDAEFARNGDDVTWLQARPLVAAPASHAPSTLAERGRWQLDAEHNPDPLSTAQASLVAFVDALGVGARQRVVDRYLYVERGAPKRGLMPIPLATLRRRFDDDVVPDCTRALDDAAAAGTIDAALAAYAHVYRRYVGEVSPSLAAARAQLAAPTGAGGATLARDQRLWELGRGQVTLDAYLARFGDHAPAWDVDAATDRERPDRVRALAAAMAAEAESPLARQARVATTVDAALRDVLAIAEDDDLLFYRAQATVRRALLALGAGDDVFEVTLDEARAGDFSRAAARRAERLAAARRVPPLAFSDGVPEWPTATGRDILRGAGIAGHARGRAVVVRALADAPASLPADAVLVVPAIVPSLTPLLTMARALVTDHGGALSHGATLAREYGLPAVLGVRYATALADGTALYVDGDAGRVYVL